MSDLKEIVYDIKKEFKELTGSTAMFKILKTKVKLNLPELWLKDPYNYKVYLQILHRVILEKPTYKKPLKDIILLDGVNFEDPETAWYHGYMCRVFEEIDNFKTPLIPDFSEEEEDEDDEGEEYE